MTPHVAALLEGASRLVSYPSATYVEDLDWLAATVAPLDDTAAGNLGAFANRVRGSSVETLQELFTQTFDLNPVCALEVGWHLFGEEYERGTFLVRMRESLRAHGIAENGELPDHLASMLRFVALASEQEADLLVEHALLPAVGKMLVNLEQCQSPFHPLVSAIHVVLAAGAPAAQEVRHV